MQFSGENFSTCLVMNYCICTTGGQDVSNILAVSILFYHFFSSILISILKIITLFHLNTQLDSSSKTLSWVWCFSVEWQRI